jgi:hypothetical protein
VKAASAKSKREPVASEARSASAGGAKETSGAQSKAATGAAGVAAADQTVTNGTLALLLCVHSRSKVA